MPFLAVKTAEAQPPAAVPLPTPEDARSSYWEYCYEYAGGEVCEWYEGPWMEEYHANPLPAWVVIMIMGLAVNATWAALTSWADDWFGGNGQLPHHVEYQVNMCMNNPGYQGLNLSHNVGSGWHIDCSIELPPWPPGSGGV